MDTLQKLTNRHQFSATFKLVIVGVLIIVCVVPSFFVMLLLSERTNRQGEAVKEITDKWGGSQVIAGPILSLPYYKVTIDSSGYKHESSGVMNVLPQKLHYNAAINPEIRSRGIFDAVIYKTTIDGEGSFLMPDLQYSTIKTGDIQWDKVFIAIGISDTRGIVREINLQWNGASRVFEPGAKNPAVGLGGIHAFVPIDISKKSFVFPTDISETLSIEASPTVTAKTSGFNLLPLHFGQILTTMYCSISCLVQSESVS